MSDVKRFWADLCVHHVEAVLYSDYAALEAELAKLRAGLDGFVLVPVEPTPEMVSAAEEAHMPFGDMDIALRMAMLAAPAPVQCATDTAQWPTTPGLSAARPSGDELWEQTLTERDSYHEAADELTAAIAKHFGQDFGEHSSMNEPWANALEFMREFAPVQAEPASPWVAVSERIEEAFQFGFNAPVTYNDVLENDVAEAWEKEKVYLLRPLPAGPEVAP